MNLTRKPISLREANAYVAAYHRHSMPSQGHKFSIGAMKGDDLVGVAIVGRPRSRMLDNGYVFEVLRVCTLGERNACSLLYGASRRASLAMGYTRGVTYIRGDEDGASLKASGWWPTEVVPAQEWSRPSRRRQDAEYEVVPRVRWETK